LFFVIVRGKYRNKIKKQKKIEKYFFLEGREEDVIFVKE